jgi:hypothetical protein
MQERANTQCSTAAEFYSLPRVALDTFSSVKMPLWRHNAEPPHVGLRECRPKMRRSRKGADFANPVALCAVPLLLV